jgi:large subunit ribosomal protein L5
MRDVRIDKIVINIGTGNDTNANDNAKKLLKTLTGGKPTNAVAKNRIPTFKISKGTSIGSFVTVRGKDSEELAKRLFKTVDNRIGRRAVSGNTVNFGIKEYIDIPGLKYDPNIGIIGMNVNISFKRSGLRVARRKRARGVIDRGHMMIGREEIEGYLNRNFGVKVETGVE